MITNCNPQANFLKLIEFSSSANFDLIDCVRREIKKLSEKWMDLCQHAENKERILEDIYLVRIELTMELSIELIELIERSDDQFI